MNENKKTVYIGGEGVFTAISVGFFFVLVGALLVITPNIFDETLDFVRNIELADVPHSDIIFPAPASPSSHTVFYQAAAQFSFALGVFQFVMLTLRFFAQSPWRKQTETVGNLIFWLGAGFLIQTFLLDTTQWFVYWSLLLVVVGVSLIARAMVLAAARL